MKYSIIINPNNENSSALQHAQGFIEAIFKTNSNKKLIIDVFLYGHAVKYAFEKNKKFKKLHIMGANLSACSTIAESYITSSKKPVSYINLNGLGHWLESTIDADKNIEFI